MNKLGLRRVAGVSVVLGIAVGAFEACGQNTQQPNNVGGSPGGDGGVVNRDSSAFSDGSGDSPTDSQPNPDAASCEGGGGTLCSSLCTDLQTDPSNCGKCGNNCGPMSSCVTGMCHCAADAGEALCNGTCISVLSDINNCGSCGHKCQVSGAGACMNGYCQPTIVAMSGSSIYDLAVNSTHVWWTQPAIMNMPGSGALLRKPFAAGMTVETVLSNLPDPRGMDMPNGSAWVYWGDYNTGAINQWFISGGHQTIDYPVFGADGGEIPPVANDVTDVASGGSYVYWVANFAGQIFRTPSPNTGGAAATLLKSGEDLPFAIATDGTNVYWVDQGSGASNGSVVQMAADGSGSAITLASGEAKPNDIAIDAKNVYWVDNANPGWVKQVPIGGGTVVTLAGPPAHEGAPFGIAVDANNVYWTDYDDGSVNAVPIGGGAKIPYASNQMNPSRITVDLVNIYWISASASTISEVTK